MKETMQNNNEKTNMSGPLENKAQDQTQNPMHLSSDKDFEKLHAAYENAAFDRCREILSRLDARYPDHPTLRKYWEEIELRQAVKSMAQSNKKVEKRHKKTKSLRLGLFALVSTMLVIVTLFFSYFYFNIKVSAKQIQEEASQLAELEDQVEHLLLIGKPRSATEVLERMRTINPTYDELPELETRTYDLLVLENKYQTALEMLDEDQKQVALTLFMEIENEQPGLWDVQQQINILENNT